jgi:hypothetical protein
MYLDIDPETHSARKSVPMALGGFFPVFVSAAGAFDIMWYAVPTGFSCRNVWVVVIFSPLYMQCCLYVLGLPALGPKVRRAWLVASGVDQGPNYWHWEFIDDLFVYRWRFQ